MADTINLIFVLVLANAGLLAYFATLTALFPRRIANTRAAADAMPGRALAVGSVNLLFFGTITLLLLAVSGNATNQLVKIVVVIPAVIFLAILSIGLSLGLAGIVQLVGERLAPDAKGFRRTLWGALALSSGSSLPFVGWFILLPYAATLGLGAFIISFFAKPPEQRDSLV